MDKETLSNYGWIVICVLVLAVMIALATPFGSYISDAIKSTSNGLFDVNQEALGAAGITISDNELTKYSIINNPETEVTQGDVLVLQSDAEFDKFVKVTANGEEVPEKYYTVTEGSTIVTFTIEFSKDYTGTYEFVIVSNDGTATITITIEEQEYDHNAPELHPTGIDLGNGRTSPQTGDVYVEGNYEYRFNKFCLTDNSWGNALGIMDVSNGWGVRCINNVADPGPILESINGKPVMYMYSTFYECTNLTSAPAIPQNVINMGYAFAKTSLTTAPKIPDGVKKMSYTFYYCTALTDLSDLVIPSSVYDMYGTFYKCTSLISAPTVPSEVINMAYTFEDCTALTGTVYINTNNITSAAKSSADGSCGDCFRNVDMSKIILAGNASKDVLNLIGSTGNNWTPLS